MPNRNTQYNTLSPHKPMQIVRFNFAARKNENKTKSPNGGQQSHFSILFFSVFSAKIMTFHCKRNTKHAIFCTFSLNPNDTCNANGKSVEKSRPHSIVLILFLLFFCLFCWIHLCCCCEIQFLCQLNTKWRLNTCRHSLTQPAPIHDYMVFGTHTFLAHSCKVLNNDLCPLTSFSNQENKARKSQFQFDHMRRKSCWIFIFGFLRCVRGALVCLWTWLEIEIEILPPYLGFARCHSIRFRQFNFFLYISLWRMYVCRMFVCVSLLLLFLWHIEF